ncbi:hypothetical protein RHRU231_680057 [Rhodococcus ruber]|uniref:Uncharacterized protein n=1 Tax=Rhodococcus ruber TaxID=1830 RepID=A0A098BP01_9NOCA|nr:hypothetical protein RHRU231_680057 [Rhodococcus ruber]
MVPAAAALNTPAAAFLKILIIPLPVREVLFQTTPKSHVIELMRGRSSKHIASMRNEFQRECPRN